MKRIAIIATAIMAAAACSKTSVVFEDADSEIGIAPVARMSVKAPISGTEYDTNENFGIFAWHRILASGQTSAGWTDFSSGATAENAPVYINNGRFASETVGSTTLWGGDPQAYYWPKTGVLAFAGYSPYDELNQNGGPGITYTLLPDGGNNAPKLTVTGFTQGTYEWTSNASSVTNETIDFMWFDADDQNAVNLGSEGTASPAGVGVVFRHACSWLDFNLTAKTGSEGKFKIKKVTLKNVYTKGDFDSSAAGDSHTGDGSDPGDVTVGNGTPWDNLSEEKDIVLYDNSTGSFLGTAAEGETPATNEPLALGDLLVIPQDLNAVITGTAKDAVILTIEYEQHTVAEGSIPNTESISFDITGSDADTDTDPADQGEWLYGRHYVYTISFGLDEILIDPGTADWIEVDM